jgi:hypothetical protein
MNETPFFSGRSIAIDFQEGVVMAFKNKLDQNFMGIIQEFLFTVLKFLWKMIVYQNIV